MSSVTCSHCNENILGQLKTARQQERREMQIKAIPEKAKKNAVARTGLGLYVIGNNSTAVKVGVIVSAVTPYNWAKKLEECSDKGINWSLDHMPGLVKSYLGKGYLIHCTWQSAGQSVPVITPMVNAFELAIGFKLGVQGYNRAEEMIRDGSEIRSLPKKIITRVEAVASTYAFAHMITKPQNIRAAGVAATLTAAFPGQMEVVHRKIDIAVSRIPTEASVVMCALYGAHEVYFKYFGGTVPYVTEAVSLTELGVSFYAGVKYFLHNSRQAEAAQQSKLVEIEEIN